MHPESNPIRRHHRLDADFRPRGCPNPDCPSRGGRAPFLWKRRGTFLREVDLRVVQRFKCLVCERGFSSQTFRLDYRYHRPRLHLALFLKLGDKCSLRQAARELACHRDSLLLRLARMGPHARWLNAAFLEEHLRRRGGLVGLFQLDELETFETDRRLFPVTVPVLIHAKSRFLVHSEPATLPARGNLRPADRRRLERAERKHGKRRNGSRAAVTACFRALAAAVTGHGAVRVRTDEKASYPAILREVFAGRVVHETVNSREPRGDTSRLFPINHTLAMLRDGLGRLVRRNWGHSKHRRNLGWHLAVWALYRNYVREWTNQEQDRSSATEVGIVERRLTPDEVLEWTDRLPDVA